MSSELASLKCLMEGRAARTRKRADVAQLAERVLGKDEVTSSILVIGSRLRSLASRNELRLGRPASEVCHAEAPQARRRTDSRQL